MTYEDMVIKKSLVPGFLYQQHRKHLAIDDPLETGWIVIGRKWYWVGVSEWRALTVYANFHIDLPHEDYLIPDRAVTNIERRSKIQLVLDALNRRLPNV